ncbi:MAG: choice-of-anchor L domain-containing protein [Saprospiraceae bacterium]|nr:choice-of-anchor L domain-containing protein [Saprospiraceae bacterium]
MSKFFTFLACWLLLAQSVSAQFLDVAPGDIAPYNNMADLLRDHLTGSGIEILDVQFDGVPAAMGYFTGGDDAIGLHRGLILSTGRASSQGTSNGAQDTGIDFASTDNNFDLDDDLLAAQTTGPLYDLVRYRITFRASSDSIRFRYVFASEEYPEYSCSPFNDVFGFFLEGPGYAAPINIARVPGSNLPVAINNVHPNNAIYDCPPLNASFYHDNNQSNEQPVYDGFLSIFTAEAAVQPCGVYTMTLALADVSDGVFDSAVFLEANSFVAEADISVSFSPGEAVLPENALADTIAMTFSAIPPDLLPLTLSLEGTATNGADYESIATVYTISTSDTVLHLLIQPVADTLEELFETVALTVRDTGCFYRVFTIYLADPDSAFKPVQITALNGGLAVLNAASPSALNHLDWTVSNNNPLAIDPPLTMVYADLAVLAGGDGQKPTDLAAAGKMPLSTLSDLSLLESVCVNIQHGWDDDLNLYLFAPNGRFVELSTDNGGNGDNYTNTCFSPAATQSITFGAPFAPASAAPFTGTFQPEGNWNDILGAPLDGVWRLGLLDDNSGFQGQLLNWSLSFNGVNLGAFQYKWNTGDTSQTLTVTEAGMYTVTISNALSAFTQTFVVQPECSVVAEIEAGVCPGSAYNFNGTTLETPGVYTQTLVAPNGCDSLIVLTLYNFPADNDTLHVVLAPGQTYDFYGQTLSQAGEYTQILTNAFGCDSTIYLLLDIVSTADQLADIATFHISPNPASGNTLLRWDAAKGFRQLRVYDPGGRMIYTANVAQTDQWPLRTADWQAGWYWVELSGDAGNTAGKRLLVR